jgi:hypothetical protein
MEGWFQSHQNSDRSWRITSRPTAEIGASRPIAVRPGEGRFTQPTAGAQPQRQEQVFMPLFRFSYRPNGRLPSKYRPPSARFIDVFVGQTFFGQRYGSYPDIDAEENHKGRVPFGTAPGKCSGGGC